MVYITVETLDNIRDSQRACRLHNLHCSEGFQMTHSYVLGKHEPHYDVPCTLAHVAWLEFYDWTPWDYVHVDRNVHHPVHVY